MTRKEKDLIEQLDTLKKAFMCVADEFMISDDNYSNIVSDKYPFHKDFYELTFDVVEWVEYIKEKVGR